MGRGPKPRHPSVHALNGEPHLRRRNLQEPEKVDVPLGINQIVHTATAAIPDFVTTPRERAAFKTVIDDYLQRRVARSADLPAYGRWAVYLEMFIEVKTKVAAEKPHLSGDRTLMRTLKDLEEMLSKLEGSLGLNPMARQQIIRTLAAVPASKMVEEQSKPDRKSKKPTEEAMPLSFLRVQ